MTISLEVAPMFGILSAVAPLFGNRILPSCAPAPKCGHGAKCCTCATEMHHFEVKCLFAINLTDGASMLHCLPNSPRHRAYPTILPLLTVVSLDGAKPTASMPFPHHFMPNAPLRLRIIRPRFSPFLQPLAGAVLAVLCFSRLALKSLIRLRCLCAPAVSPSITGAEA